MKHLKRYIKWATAGLGTVVLAAVAFAAPNLATEDLTTWVSPGTSAQVDLNETLDVTLHLQGTAGDEIDLQVAASSGSVDPASGSVTLNPQGKAAFDVVYTPSAEGDHTVTFSSDDFDDVVVNVKVNPAEEEVEEEEEEEEPTDTAGANHGQCVAGWAHRAKAEGLERKFFGQFVSTVAGDKSAVAESKDDIVAGNAPESCDFSELLAEKLAEQEAAPAPGSAGGKGKGKAQGGRP